MMGGVGAAAVVALLLSASSPLAGLAKAYALVDDLSYAEAIPVAHAVVEDPAATQEQKIEAMFIEAYCDAVTDKPQEASDVFKRIVALDIDAKPKLKMEFKAQYLFVQAHDEEMAKRQAAADAEKKTLFATVHLLVDKPENLVGGQRAVFTVKLDDPNGVVKSMRVDFKKPDEPEFYSLPLVRSDDGRWVGAIPGTYTKSTKLLRLLYFITASSASRDAVVSDGSREAPNELFVEKGADVADDLKANERLPWGTRLFYGGVGTPVLASVGFLAGAGIFSGPLEQANKDFKKNPSGPNKGGRAFADVLLAVVPGALATAAAYAVDRELIDGWPSAMPAVVVGIGTGMYALAVMAKVPEVDPTVPGPLALKFDDPLQFAAAYGGIAIAVVGSFAVPMILIAQDKPE